MKRGAAWLPALAAAVIWLAAMTIYLAQQETPTGWLRGKAVAEETGQPLPGVEIRLRHTAAPSGDAGGGEFVLHTRADGTFESKRIPAGTYSLQATSRAHRLRTTDLAVAEGKVQEVNLELAPVPPFFDLRMPQHVFTPDETPQVIAHGFLPGDAVEFAFYRVDTRTLFLEKRGGLRGMLYSQRPPRHLVIEGNPALTLWKRTSARITQRDVEGVFRQRFDLPAGEAGVYLVVAKANSIQRLGWVMVTRVALITKRWGDRVLAYVTDLSSGRPIPGAAVEFSAEGGGRVSGVTDADGLFAARLPGERRSFSLLARAEHEGSEAFLTSWVWRGEEDGEERVYAYTDRPVYRPGNEVSFKGIARRFAGADYAVLSNESVEVEVRDPRDTLVYKAALTSNDFGSYHAGFQLNDEAPTGYYRLLSTFDGEPHESGFAVAEYRKPEYSVEVTAAKKRYTRGERIQARVAAEYYFGAPVAGADVAYRVYRSPYWFYPGGEEGYYEGEEFEGYDYGEIIEEGQARTGPDGVARFTIPTRRETRGRDERAEEIPSDYRYAIEATVTDASRKEVTADGSVLVTQGEFRLSARAVSYIATPGDAVDIEVGARDYRERPVRGVRVTVSAQRQVWGAQDVSLEPGPRGQVTTDAKGKATFRFTPQTPGYYRIETSARDRRGNQIRGRGYLWVTSAVYADLGMPYPKLEIVADKEVYREGDTAVLLINSQSKGATALVTVEGPRLYQHRLVELKGNSTRVEIPIEREYAPNFFVSVAFVRDKQFANEQKRIKVSVEKRRLRVEVKPDQQRYAPGERATYEIRTTDWRGDAVRAELSVGIVDESIYAIEEERAPPMVEFFYPPRWNQVSTDYSFPQIYLDADKGAAGITVRKRFPDTAYWNPTVVTDAEGRASVSFAMPDTLTTWRATVRGATLDTAVGEATAKAQTFKELLVRLETPRFVVQKDRLTLSALVHNYTRARQDVEVWITAPGLSVRGGAGAEERQRMVLGPDEVKRQDWQVDVPSPGDKAITVYAKARSGLSDAMALTIPALPHGRERVEWRSGAVRDQAAERLSIRRDAVAGASDVRVRFAPSIAAVILGALEYLAQYPYGCTEQTMSSFLPDVIVARALRELDLANPELEKKLPDMVQEGLDRLYGYQHDDGGWGWWRYDDSEPWMTAYVVYGLTTAKRNGFAVNQNALDRGLGWLVRRLKDQRHMRANDRLYVLYVLSLAGRDGVVDGHVTDFYRRLDSLDAYELALLTSTLVERKRSEEAKVAGERLWRRLQETQALAWWKGRGDWGRGGDTETTGLALKALLALDPDDPRIYKVVRWLVLHREGNCWVSTRDTAFVLFALTDFMKASQELQPDYQAAAILGDDAILQRRFTQDDLFAPEVEVKASGDALRRGENLLNLSKEGPGNLYYTLILRQFVGQEDLPQVITGAGISIERQYYRMISSRDRRNGVISTTPAPNPTTVFRSGESILARLRITSSKEYEYVVVEDPLPAGCEVAERGGVDPWEWGWWWSDMEVRDEKVAIFARRLPAGTSTIEYHLRPQIPGEYHVMPTQAYSMYNPDVRGSGAETRVRLR
ncbi:MAG: carboxypeptidase regulatory-like domain-containing protein [Armatimonadota bacterium]|nr:MAG: carboxypeptidase regulatory-like domain-containing protein [Armatimonadota bacterium]